jgi:hypothetical protein
LPNQRRIHSTDGRRTLARHRSFVYDNGQDACVNRNSLDRNQAIRAVDVEMFRVRRGVRRWDDLSPTANPGSDRPRQPKLRDALQTNAPRLRAGRYSGRTRVTPPYLPPVQKIRKTEIRAISPLCRTSLIGFCAKRAPSRRLLTQPLDPLPLARFRFCNLFGANARIK